MKRYKKYFKEAHAADVVTKKYPNLVFVVDNSKFRNITRAFRNGYNTLLNAQGTISKDDIKTGKYMFKYIESYSEDIAKQGASALYEIYQQNNFIGVLIDDHYRNFSGYRLSVIPELAQ